MLRGTASTDELVAHVATMASFDAAGLSLPDTLMFQAMFEIRVAARETSLPAGQHPTNPPTLVVQAWRCPDSPWGPFTCAQARVACRSGLRPRGMVQGCVVDNAAAVEALRRDWGFPAQFGAVRLDANYHDARLEVAVGGALAIGLHAFDPVPLGLDDVSYSTTVALAHTPRGLRLVQIDADLTVARAERLTARMPTFDAAAFGVHPSVEIAHPVSASVSRGSLALHPLRYVCRPDELAFTGTESVSVS